MTTRRALMIDATLALALVVSLVAFLRSSDLHGIVSLLLIGAVAVHVAVHRRWIARTVRRTRRAVGAHSRAVRDLTVATALAVVFVPMALTGVSLLSNLDRGDDLHTVTGWLFVSLVAVHITLHARWVQRAVAR